MNLDIKHHLAAVLISFISATFIDGLSDFWNKEAVWILFVTAGIIISFLKDSLDSAKKVTIKKMTWTLVVVVVLCGLLRFYKQEENISQFWFYFWTVMIGVFSPSAVFKILQNSDDKAENAFSKIVSAFVDGLVFKINSIFGNKKNNENGE